MKFIWEAPKFFLTSWLILLRLTTGKIVYIKRITLFAILKLHYFLDIAPFSRRFFNNISLYSQPKNIQIVKDFIFINFFFLLLCLSVFVSLLDFQLHAWPPNIAIV